MRLVILIVFLLLISWTDIRYHRIPNCVLFLLLVTLIPQAHFPNFVETSLISILLVAFTYVSKMGMGDLKLLLIQLWLLNPIFLTFKYFLAVTVLSLFLVIAQKVRHRTGDVPFGPVLMAAIVVASLDI